MEDSARRAIAIVGVSSILPDAPNVASFWRNLVEGRYSISDVDPARWDPDLYYDPDPQAPDKAYSKIGGWVRDWEWEPMKWHLPVPPKVADAMDEGQKWAVACARAALLDFGHPERPLDLERTACIVGTAMAGELHYETTLRVQFPQYARSLAETAAFKALPADSREAILAQFHARIGEAMPTVSEDTMPGELANCTAGRIANLFDLHGPNYVCDAACASALAAIDSAMEGLVENEYDAALVGGVDRNMGPSTYVKFCKIGALSATGTRPYSEGADGFVMGEGAAFFLLKRLADAERDGDRVYAVIRGVGGSSDGRGKGITAPNPVGQRLAIERAWRRAGISPAEAGLVEGHGTSTRVGDVVEVGALASVFGAAGAAPGSIPLGSVKSNIGHLKGAAGAAGLLKVLLALHERTLPPSLHCETPNPNVAWGESPFFVNTEAKPWDTPPNGVRTAGVSAFGFGGTNFHAVVEEHVPGRLTRRGASVSVPERVSAVESVRVEVSERRAPLRGALVLGAESPAALGQRLDTVLQDAIAGRAPAVARPQAADLRAPHRLTIDYADAAELAVRAKRARKALASDQPAMWRAVRAQGVHRGRAEPSRVAFLFTGQGSQYPNMLGDLRESEPVVSETFEEADRIMAPLLERPLTDYIVADPEDENAIERAAADLRRTEITQPAVLTIDIALTRLLASYGIVPDFVMGHSLGEYGALVASGALPFEDALIAVSARGRGMASLSIPDQGKMAAVFGPLEEIEAVVRETPGNVVVANVNSSSQAVVGGASDAVDAAVAIFSEREMKTVPLPVSHAFHTSIVAPASEPLREVLSDLRLTEPVVPMISNVTGGFYPTGPDAVPAMLDLLAAQVASPVQFVKGLEALYAEGVRAFVEVGPKSALQGFADDLLGQRPDVVTLFTNHPKVGDAASFNQALCGLYAAGRGEARSEPRGEPAAQAPSTLASDRGAATDQSALPPDRYTELGRLFAEVLDRGARILGREAGEAPARIVPVVTGASVGLPGGDRVFDADNVRRLIDGEQMIEVIPGRLRRAIVDKHITRLVKSDEGARFETIERPEEVIKLAGRAGKLDLESEFGVSSERVAALDTVTQLAIAAGIEALRDAGLPLVMHYRITHKGTRIPERWMLPDALRDETGVIFASAFPGYDSFAQELTHSLEDQGRHRLLETLEALQSRLDDGAEAGEVMRAELEHRIHAIRDEIEAHSYQFDRRFLFRVLAMGHSQFAETIGARGPNTQLNAACASATQAFSVAQDWIQTGRCRRVIVVSADDVTTDNLLEWVGAGFLASGAAATDEVVENAALPFDRRRHGMIMGMGAAGFVIEHPDCAAERGLRAICEVLSTVTANSAFHGTRLDIEHIETVMEQLIAQAEARHGLDRRDIASELVFVSHETYTPARGGSAAAEVNALRKVFGEAAAKIVVANTKGLTGHAMGVGIEDAVAVKSLETGLVPPIANYRDPDPELGPLHLSQGGAYPVRYALRLGAGFGSQISMSLLRWLPTADGHRPDPDELGYASRVADAQRWSQWLREVSGDPEAEVETVKRTLRVRDRGPAARPPARSEPLPLEPPILKQAGVPLAVQPTLQGTPPAPPAPAPDDPDAEIRERVLGIVADKTGYPTDMLDLDLDLEADLGVDTVKQAETFASIREAYAIPRDETLKLRDYPTIADAIQFVKDRAPGLAASPSSDDTSTPPAPAPDDPDAEIRERVLGIVADKTGYPTDMLDLDLDLEADLGVDTVKQAETFASIREAYAIPRDETLKLRDYPTIADAIQFVKDRAPGLAASPSSDDTSTPPAPAPDDPDAEIRERVLGIVADKTGYPTDMLDLDLDLEADLGVDTVKQAETFASIREAYAIPRDETLKLRDYPTIAHAIQFVKDRAPGLAASPSSDDTPTPEESEAPEAAANSIPRRVPVPVLRPPLEICRNTGLSLAEGERIVLMPDEGGAGAALADLLARRGVSVLALDPDDDLTTISNRLAGWLDEGPIHGLYWLPALDVAGAIQALDLVEWRNALRLRVVHLHAVARQLFESLTGPDRFLVAATRLGGLHGYGDTAVAAPLGGGVTGFAKAFARESPQTLVKAVDFPAAEGGPAGNADDAQTIAETLVEETLRDPGVVEVGRHAAGRWSVALAEEPLAGEGRSLDAEAEFVITGAAGGIVAAIIEDLARASAGTFHLLDLVEEPAEDDPDIELFERDRVALQRSLFERLKQTSDRVTPVQVEREMARVERAHSALSAIRAVRDAGGHFTWHSVDLADGDAVAKALEMLRPRGDGPAPILIHAAGLEISRGIPAKEVAEFERVLGVKCDGWFNLMHALAANPPSAAVVFSSIAGRFGNAGQADYSAANDLLCKQISSLRQFHPQTRGIAIDWTAWGDIGMATRGSIPQIMARAGIEMLPAAEGVPIVRRELESGGPGGEVLIGGQLGVLLEERDPAGGVDPEAVSPRTSGALVERLHRGGVTSGLRANVTLDPSAQPFLDEHRIDGTAVLPGVMGVEAFAQLAQEIAGGRGLRAVEDVHFLAPFKLYRDEPRQAELVAQVEWAPRDEVLARCALVGRRMLVGQDEAKETTHFTATLRLGADSWSGAEGTAPATGPQSVVSATDIYRVYFHGPAFQVLECAWRDGDRVVGQLRSPLPPCTPDDVTLVAAPRLLELCFQTAGVWEIGTRSRMGLPRHIERVQIASRDGAPQSPCHAVVSPRDDGAFDAQVVDADGAVWLRMEGYETEPLPIQLDPELCAPLRRAMGA